jgi:hypothetical protein
LLALDISANYLGAVPPALTHCISLEELNISSNPLRVLPEFLADLTQLRVLIADSTGISTLPDTLHELDKLHTLSIRRNKLYSLPSWLCLLPALQTILLDGNPFQGPWKALVDPLLTKETPPPSAITTAATPTTGTTSSAYYPLSTPMFPLASASASSLAGGDTDTDDSPNGSDGETGVSAGGHPRSGVPNPLTGATTEEDTIVPHRAAQISRAVTSPVPLGLTPGAALPFPATGGPFPSPTPSSSSSRGLQRTRTAPNRSYNRSRDLDSPSMPDGPIPSPAASTAAAGPKADDSGYFDHEIRRMKSAGELRGGIKRQQQQQPPQPQVPMPVSQSIPTTPERPQIAHSASSSNLLSMRAEGASSLSGPAVPTTMSNNVLPKRYASLGAASGMTKTPSKRPGVPRSMWNDDISEDDSEAEVSATGGRTSDVSPVASPPSQSQLRSAPSMRRGEGNDGQQPQSANPRTSQHVRAAAKEKEKEKEKSGRWGFLKKMSMGRMRNESPSSPPAPMPTTSFAARHVNHPSVTIGRQTPTPQRRTPSIAGAGALGPQISMRISTTGTLSVLQDSEAPVFNVSPAEDDELINKPQPPTIATAVTAQAPPSPSPVGLNTSPSLMVPPSPTPRSAKRRSFLPLDLVPPAGVADGTPSLSVLGAHPVVANSGNGLNIPIPPTSAFVPTSVVTNEADAAVVRMMPSAQFEHEQLLRREEEKARETYARALRSVMAYLKDMNDLSIVQAPTLGVDDQAAGTVRLRRPTMSDQHRVFSDSSIETMGSAGAASAGSGSSGGAVLSRPGSSALGVGRTGMQTLSVASTDSNGSGGSGEERKFKDDKSKRAMVVREIVECV